MLLLQTVVKSFEASDWQGKSKSEQICVDDAFHFFGSCRDHFQWGVRFEIDNAGCGFVGIVLPFRRDDGN